MLPEAELAGTLAFTAALFARELGEDAVAVGLAQRSAAWHRGYGRAEAEAESLELAADVSPDPWEAVGMLHRAGGLHAREGRWIAAATCRRGLALPLLEVAGLGAAEHALARAQAALKWSGRPGRTGTGWHGSRSRWRIRRPGCSPRPGRCIGRCRPAKDSTPLSGRWTTRTRRGR